MKIIIRLLAVITILSVLSSCDNDDDTPPNPNVTFQATLTGAQEAPANASTATGNATLTFNTNTKIFTLTVTHSITNPTNGHIHKGAVGVSGGVVFPFSSFTSPISLHQRCFGCNPGSRSECQSLLC